MGETRVDLAHLLEDLRDAYPGSLEETILTEILANALDSGASRVDLVADPAVGHVLAIDDGTGMQRRELARYHDIASSTKVRGEGIGFAGVGIKLGLLACRRVVTETRRGKSHVATEWRLASRHRAPWRWIPPPGLVTQRGTAVRLEPHNALSPLLDPGFVEQVVRRHYASLLEPDLTRFLSAQYPQGVRIAVNGRMVDADGAHGDGGERASIEVRLARKRKPSALGYLVRSVRPLAEDDRGVAISTYGKVIKRGWDWLGLSPALHDHVTGLVEAPALAGCLTLNKGDFARSGSRGALYLAFRKAIQEAVSRQLAAWGDVPEAPREVRPKVPGLVRDLERVLEDLAIDFPLLGSLVERRRGQRRLPMVSEAGPELVGETPLFAVLNGEAARTEAENVGEGIGAPASAKLCPPESEAPPQGEVDGEPTQGPPASTPVSPLPASPSSVAAGELDPGGAVRARSRRALRYGLDVQFEERADDEELGRLVESTVWVNTAHPAYRRAAASRSLGYHIALAVALALAPLAVQPPEEHGFVTTFLARWGEAVDGATKRRHGRRRPNGRRRPRARD